ncbi:MAG: hypothetical protein ABMA64_25730 [Myxococcota bacterium]
MSELESRWTVDGMTARVRVFPADDGAWTLDVGRRLLARIGPNLGVVAAGVLVALGVGSTQLGGMFIVAGFGIAALAWLGQQKKAVTRTLTLSRSRLTLEGVGSWDLTGFRRVDAWKGSLGIFDERGEPARTVLLDHDDAVVAWLAEQLNGAIRPKLPESPADLAAGELLRGLVGEVDRR